MMIKNGYYENDVMAVAKKWAAMIFLVIICPNFLYGARLKMFTIIMGFFRTIVCTS